MELTDTQLTILLALEDSEPLTYKELAKAVGTSPSTIRARVAETIKAGYGVEKHKNSEGTVFLSYNKDRRIAEIGKAIPEFETLKTRYKSANTFNKMRNEISSLKNKIKPVPIKKNKTEQEALAVLSDWHIGKKIVNHHQFKYDIRIANERVDELANNLVNQLNEMKISHLHLAVLGDMVDGDQIYKTHPFEIEVVAAEQVKVATKALVRLINTLTSNGITCDVHCIRGNHGQVSYNTVYEDNWDNMVYSHLELVYDDNKKVSILHSVHDEHIIEIEGRRVLLYHGNGIPAQISTSSGSNTFRGLVGKYRLDDGDMIVIGHLHTFGVEQDQNIMLLRNGSLCDTNEYAWKKNLFGQPCQTLVVFNKHKVHPTFVPIEVE